MSFFDDVDDGYEGVGERMEHGGLIPPGYYRAKLVGAKEVESKSKGTPGYELTFVVQGGPFDGKEVSDTLWKTDHQFSKDRIKLACVRLGLRKPSPDGKRLLPVEGKADFMDCVDAETVIEIVHEPDQKDPNKKWVRIAPNGFHDASQTKVKEALARTAKGGPAKPAAGKPAEEKPADKPAAPATPPANKRDVRKL